MLFASIIVKKKMSYSKIFLNRPTIGPTLNGPFKGGDRIREKEYHYNDFIWAIVWYPNKVIDIGEWSICDSDRLEVLLIVHM